MAETAFQYNLRLVIGRYSRDHPMPCHLRPGIASSSSDMEVKVKHLGDVKFEATTRGHRVMCDQPPENGGADSAMTPPEFLLVSLGTCAGFYAAQYLKTRSLAVPDLEIRVAADKAMQPARLGSFRIEVIAPGLDPHHEAGMLRAVKACLVHNTLLNAPAIETIVNTAVPAAV
jgi:putative redox protein